MDFSSLVDRSKRVFGHWGKSSDSIVAIDIGSSSVKVIQLRQDKGRAVLETYGELATGPYVELSIGQAVSLDSAKLTTVLSDLFREANVTATVGAMAIPLRSSLLVAIEMPRLAKNDLATMVPTEARKYVPVPIQEVVLDWWVIPERDDPTGVKREGATTQVEVLVAAIHKDTVKTYETISQNIKLENRFFEIETFSAIRAALSNDLSATAIVDFGAGTTKVAIVDYGVVRFSHTINKGGQDLSMALSRSLNISFAKAEEIKRQVGLVEAVSLGGEVSTVISPLIEYVFSEINHAIVNYQKKHQRAVEKIIFIGGGAQLPGLVAAAGKTIEPAITIGTPFDKVETPAFLEPILKSAGPSFAVALGLALRQLEG